MIEIVSAERCTGCNICVHVCPTNVFDIVNKAAPVIARQRDCQSCFMCELYCPADALYVAPDPDRLTAPNEQSLADRAVLGSYRAAIGWTAETRPQRSRDESFKLMGGR